MKKIGPDVAFNYKTMSTEVLTKEGPIDMYVFDKTVPFLVLNANDADIGTISAVGLWNMPLPLRMLGDASSQANPSSSERYLLTSPVYVGMRDDFR